MDTFIWAVNMLSRIAGMVAAFFIALAVLVICDMVVERYIFNLTTIWQLDVVTYSIIATTFVGSAYVLMTRGHVNVDVVPIYLGPRARYWLAIFANLLALGFLRGAVRSVHAILVPVLDRRTGTPTRSGARRCGFPISRCRSGLGLLVLQYVADLIAVVDRARAAVRTQP